MAVVKQYDRTPLITSRKEKIFYSDFFKNFNIHPEKKDLARHVNEYAVSEALRNLLLTNKGEKFFNGNYGGDISRMLFEQIDPFTITTINTFIQNAIQNFEPRIRVISINTEAVPDEKVSGTKIYQPGKTELARETEAPGIEVTNTVRVEIVYSLINSTTPVTLTLILDRVR